jgi:hypothetical protein
MIRMIRRGRKKRLLGGTGGEMGFVRRVRKIRGGG